MTLFNNAFSIAIGLPRRKLLKLLIWSASGTAIEKLVRSMSSDWGQSRPFLISKQMNSQCVPCQYTIGLQSPHSVTPMTSGRLWDLLDWVIHGYTMTTAATRVPSVGMQNNVRNHIWWMQLNSLTAGEEKVLWSNWRQSWHPHTVTWLNFSRCEIVCSNLRQVLWWEVSAPINMNILTKHRTPDLLTSCVTSDLCSI